MPGLSCTCGHHILYGEIPCKDEWLLISDVEFDGFSGLVEAEDVYRAMRSLLRCSSCGRLWVFWDGYPGLAQEFLPAKTSG